MMSRQGKKEYNATINYNRGFDLQDSGDIDGAISAYRIAARYGATDAMSRLGTIFDDYVEYKDEKKALYWYKRGFRLGDSSCAWNLAMHYAGKGNKRWYIHWLIVADKMGYMPEKDEISERNWWNKRNK